MKRMNEKEDRLMTDSEMASGLSDLGIPYVDMGEDSKNIRFEGPNGEIVDEVVQSGEKGESLTVDAPSVTAIKNAREIKRQRDISNGNRFDTI